MVSMTSAYGLCVRDRDARSTQVAVRAYIVTKTSIEHLFDIMSG